MLRLTALLSVCGAAASNELHRPSAAYLAFSAEVDGLMPLMSPDGAFVHRGRDLGAAALRFPEGPVTLGCDGLRCENGIPGGLASAAKQVRDMIIDVPQCIEALEQVRFIAKNLLHPELRLYDIGAAGLNDGE